MTADGCTGCLLCTVIFRINQSILVLLFTAVVAPVQIKVDVDCRSVELVEGHLVGVVIVAEYEIPGFLGWRALGAHALFSWSFGFLAGCQVFKTVTPSQPKKKFDESINFVENTQLDD